MIDLRDQIPSGYTGRYPLILDQVIRRVWHHTVSNFYWNAAANATQDEEIAHLIAIDQMHAAWGLNGFGYHNAAFSSGRAYQVGSYDKARAHVASGQNSYSIGTVLIGNFTNALPSQGHMAAAKACRRSIEDFYRRKLEGLPHLLVPGQNTACPGARWSEWVPLLEGEEGMNAADKAWVLQFSGGQKLVRATGPDVYIVRNDGKRRFPVSGGAGPQAFKDVGFHWEDVIIIPDEVLRAIPDAP